jgi:hypothetical protein
MSRAGLVLICFTLGCGEGRSRADAGVLRSNTFIALGLDFSGYDKWQRFDLGDHPANNVHLAGNRVVYLNKAPEPGATSFPVGTILVKVVTPPGAALDQIFAMVKRGGEFNSGGAVGWEWFELDAAAPGPVIFWRGEVPPVTQSYGGGGSGACNECHRDAMNDFVLAPELSLGKF